MRSTMSYLTFSALVFLSACSHVQRPDSWICGVNAKGMKLRCYNVKDDYTDDGTLKPDAKPTEHQIHSLSDMNAWVCMDPTSLGKFKTYLADLRDYAKDHCN
ncbi:hypothetical protein CCP2SC5_1020022 [Azospirillaceae bacterium]